MDILYYRINRKSNLILFEDMAMDRTKAALNIELNNSTDKELGEKTDAIFNSIIGYYKVKEKEKDKDKDKLELIYILLEQYKKQKKIKFNDNSLSLNLCQQIASKNYKTTFSFTAENMNEVATLLFFGFKKLRDLKKNLYNYDTFLNEIQNYKGKYLDLVRTYQKSAKNDKIEIKEHEIPNELLLLLEVFRNVKTLDISIEEACHESIITYLLILFNNDWLFPCVFNLILDLSCSKVNKEVLNIYKKKFNKFYADYLTSDEFNDKEIIDKILENIKLEEEMKLNSNKNDKKVEKDKKSKKAEKEALKLKIKNDREFNEMLSKSYPSVINNNKNVFDTLLLLINFIKKLSFINKLVINIPDGYNIEINDYLRLKGVPGVSKIQFVDFLSTIKNLRELDVKFNSIEASTFEKILYMIKNNKNLQKLKINFFPAEDTYFSTYQLLKIEEDNIVREMSKKHFENKSITLNGCLIYDDIKDEYNLRKKALDNLEKSVEKFFLLLQMMEEKSNLESLTLEVNQPFKKIDKDIHWIFLKLLFNLILEFNRELMDLKEFKIIIPDLNLDNNCYIFIETFLNCINLNEKNKSMKHFHLQTQITNLPNLCNLISYNLETIYIGDLDYLSFKSLLSFYHSKEFIENSKLKKFTLCLSKSIVVLRECNEEITDLISGQNPETLYELCLSCHFNIGHEELMEIMSKANGNQVQKYTFIMKMVSEKDYMNVFRSANLYYLNKIFKSNIDRYLPLLVKYKLLDKDKTNIAKKLIQFLIPSNRKKIIFKKI
jgi:hypothetical protein